MILGTFTWRGLTVEVESLVSTPAGEVVWLNRTDGPSLALVRDGMLRPTAFVPNDDTAALELEVAYRDFRRELEGR